MRTIGKTFGIAVLTLAFAMGGKPLEAAAPSARLVEGYGRRPLAFEQNRGQTDEQVRFLARGEGYRLFLTASEAVLALREGGSERALRLRWAGTSPAPRLSGESELPGRSHYFVGNDRSKWRTGISSYAKVRYQGVYPGIDLVFYGNQGQLEYDFVLAPGAAPETIRFAVEGADRMEIDSTGDLVLHLGGGEVRLKKPVSYQEVGGTRREVPSGYRLLDGPAPIGFEVAAWDREHPLVIDPVLVFSTYLGGSGTDTGFAVALDAAGNAYVTGYTDSPEFPVTHGPRPPQALGAYVAKLTPDGTLVYTTYIGPDSVSGFAAGFGVALDPEGNVYLSGSAGGGFPLVNPLPPAQRGDGEIDVFVAKLDPSGSTLLYSTTLGTPGQDGARGIAVDTQGHAYVTGDTQSGFPIVAPPLPPSPHLFAGFLAKLHPSGSSLVYSTTLDGLAWEVATDPAGNLYLAGSAGPNLPVINAWLPSPLGGGDGFVGKLLPSGFPVYITRVGGSRYDEAWAVTADAAGNAYVTGVTDSFDFPVLGPAQSELGFPYDVFVTKLSPAGSPVYSTYLGGSYVDWGNAIAVDPAGSAHVTGWTSSLDFPLKHPFDTECGPVIQGRYCSADAFVAKLNPQGSEIVFSTYLGGSVSSTRSESLEEGWGIAADAWGNTYVTGYTYSDDFPTIRAFQPSHGGGPVDTFIARIATNQPPDCSAAFASPAPLWPPNGKLVPITILGVTDPDGDPVTLVVTAIRQDEPPGRQGPDAAGIGTPTAQVRADRVGGGDGRVYHLTFTASDGQGGTCTGTVRVCVPHDQARRRTCGDGGALFDSTVAGR